MTIRLRDTAVLHSGPGRAFGVWCVYGHSQVGPGTYIRWGPDPLQRGHFEGEG